MFRDYFLRKSSGRMVATMGVIMGEVYGRHGTPSAFIAIEMGPKANWMRKLSIHRGNMNPNPPFQWNKSSWCNEHHMQMIRNGADVIFGPNECQALTLTRVYPHGPIIFRVKLCVFSWCLCGTQSFCAGRMKWDGMERSEIFAFN